MMNKNDVKADEKTSAKSIEDALCVSAYVYVTGTLKRAWWLCYVRAERSEGLRRDKPETQYMAR